MNKRLHLLEKELNISDNHKAADIKKVIDKVNTSLNADPEERKIYMKQKFLSAALVAVMILTISSVTVFAAVHFGWNEKLIEYFNPTERQMEELSGSVNTPQVTATDNGVTVSVIQTLADKHGIYVLYEIEAPSNFKFTDDTKWNKERFHADYGEEDKIVGMGGGMSSKILSQDNNKRTVLLHRSGSGSVINQKVKLNLSDIGYLNHDDKYTYCNFESLIKCNFEINWDFNYVDLGKTIDVNKRLHINKDNNNTLTKIDISSMSVWITIEGDDITTSLKPIINMADGTTITINAKNDFNTTSMFTNNPDMDGGTITVGYDFDKITDICHIENITVGDVVVSIN